MDKLPNQLEIAALLDAAESQEHVFFDKELVVFYRLQNGYAIAGIGSCIEFDLEIARELARADAENKLWDLEEYRKQSEPEPVEEEPRERAIAERLQEIWLLTKELARSICQHR